MRLVNGARRCDHNAGATGAALASGSASGGLQDGHSGLLVTVRYGSTLPGRRLSAALRRKSSSAALCQLKDIVSSDEPTAAMETVQVAAEDIFVRLLKARRIVTNC